MRNPYFFRRRCVPPPPRAPTARELALWDLLRLVPASRLSCVVSALCHRRRYDDPAPRPVDLLDYARHVVSGDAALPENLPAVWCDALTVATVLSPAAAPRE